MGPTTKMQFDANFVGPTVFSQGKEKAYCYFDFAVRQQVIKNTLWASLVMHNVFHTAHFNSTKTAANLESYTYVRPKFPNIALSISWSFNSDPKSKAVRCRKAAHNSPVRISNTKHILKMKNLIVATATLCLLAACSSKTSTTESGEDNTPQKEYLFTYFAGESDGLRLAHSTDGITWEELGSDSVFLVPTIGKDSLMRDPSVAESPDGTFHMVWTSGWNDRGIAYSSTKDFINWTPQKEIPVMTHEPETLNCWAPEIFYDKPSETYYIYWASTIPGRHCFVPTSDEEKQWNHRIYLTTTKDFETFTPTELWFNPSFSTIDAAIAKSPINEEYIMFVKNENSAPAEKTFARTRTKDIKAGFPVEVSEPITGEYWAEGPALSLLTILFMFISTNT